jgi:hypothetical protein
VAQGWEPALVYEVVSAMVGEAGPELNNFRTTWATSAEDLIEIALTLHRLPETRSQGLELFERFLAMEIYGVDSRLSVLDRRPFQ